MNFISIILAGGNILIDMYGGNSAPVTKYYNVVKAYHQGKATKEEIKNIFKELSSATTDNQFIDRIDEVLHCMLVQYSIVKTTTINNCSCFFNALITKVIKQDKTL